MRKRFTIAAPLTALLALAGQLLAGGFFLQLGNPEANAEARANGAVVTIKAAGCHDPATAQVTATAIGTVDGHRRSMPLTVKRLSEPGMFALSQQWPAEGRWVIELVATNGEQFTNSLMVASPDGIDRLHAKADRKPFSDSDVASLLRDTAR